MVVVSDGESSGSVEGRWPMMTGGVPEAGGREDGADGRGVSVSAPRSGVAHRPQNRDESGLSARHLGHSNSGSLVGLP